MTRTALMFSTKDRCELSRQSIRPLLQSSKFALHWSDGSSTEDGMTLPDYYLSHPIQVHRNIRGGADAAIVFGLSTLLDHPNYYDYIGLVENDVLLDDDWFEPTMALFERGQKDGLHVGAVSARCYEDRVLIQRDGYALCHNLGAGMVIFTRDAAAIVLKHCRTTWTTENRTVFAQLSGLDIGRWWAFRHGEHWLCMDWGFDKILAQHGYASLALTPAKCQMIGQVPPLAEQGLTLVREPVAPLRNEAAFTTFCNRCILIQKGALVLPTTNSWQGDHARTIIFPHHLPGLGGAYAGDWQLQWAQGYGPFSWRAQAAGAELNVPIFGACDLVIGGQGEVQVEDPACGNCRFTIPVPQGNVIRTPVKFEYRPIKLTALSPGIVFHALITDHPQPADPTFAFRHSDLPPP